MGMIKKLICYLKGHNPRFSFSENDIKIVCLCCGRSRTITIKEISDDMIERLKEEYNRPGLDWSQLTN